MDHLRTKLDTEGHSSIHNTDMTSAVYIRLSVWRCGVDQQSYTIAMPAGLNGDNWEINFRLHGNSRLPHCAVHHMDIVGCVRLPVGVFCLVLSAVGSDWKYLLCRLVT